MPTRPIRTASTTIARIGAEARRGTGSTEGRTARPARAATAAPARPSSWGSAPDRIPSRTASTIRTIASRSRGFTARSCHRSGARASHEATRPAAGARHWHCRFGRVSRPRARSAWPSPSAEIVHVPAASAPRSTAVALSIGDLDAAMSPGPEPSSTVTWIVLVVLVDVDLDGVRRVARLDAAPPAGLDDDVAVLDGRADELDVDRVGIQGALLRHDVGRGAEEGIVGGIGREREDDAATGVARLRAAAGVATGSAARLARAALAGHGRRRGPWRRRRRGSTSAPPRRRTRR